MNRRRQPLAQGRSLIPIDSRRKHGHPPDRRVRRGMEHMHDQQAPSPVHVPPSIDDREGGDLHGKPQQGISRWKAPAIQHRGWCHMPPMAPRTRLALSVDCHARRRGRAKPRQPISSPSTLLGSTYTNTTTARIPGQDRRTPPLAPSRRVDPQRGEDQHHRTQEGKDIPVPGDPPARPAGGYRTGCDDSGASRSPEARATSGQRRRACRPVSPPGARLAESRHPSQSKTRAQGRPAGRPLRYAIACICVLSARMGSEASAISQDIGGHPRREAGHHGVGSVRES